MGHPAQLIHSNHGFHLIDLANSHYLVLVVVRDHVWHHGHTLQPDVSQELITKCDTNRLPPMIDDKSLTLVNNADFRYVVSLMLGLATLERHVVVRLMLTELYELHWYCPAMV